VVSEYQRELQLLLQREPIRFYVETLEPMLDDARRRIAPFLGCDADDFGFVLNASMGVSTVVRSLTFAPGDQLLTSNHEYNACNNALDWAAERWGAKVVKAAIPFPIRSPDEAYHAIMKDVTERTKLVLVSHITSPSGIILPVERLVAELNRRGIDTLVDGAHAPGMVELDIDRLNAPYYTGNFHKWSCAANGAAFLHVRKDRQAKIRPLVISHGANSTRTDRSRFRLEFDFFGTADVTSWLTVPRALEFMGTLGAKINGNKGGPDESLKQRWRHVMQANKSLVIQGRDVLCRALGVTPNAPDEMIGSLAAVTLPAATPAHLAKKTKYHDALQDALLEKYGIQVPVYGFPAGAKSGAGRQVRISAQLHNSLEQYEYLAAMLQRELAASGS